jgi:hypothetical protein
MLIAFRNTAIDKPTILAQLSAHAKADEIIKGQYWKDGKGCAVGCTIHSGNHAEYERRFGVPQMLARLEDCIFEGLPNGEAKAWPIRFMETVKPGSDLSRVGWQFLHWLLTDRMVNPGIEHPLVKDAVRQCADILLPLTKGKPADEGDASAARSAALSAEGAAWSAAWSAACAARSTESAALSAESAALSAESAALSAESAARSTGSAALSAARSTGSAALSAESAARSAAYVRMADKLIALIRRAPIVE